MESKVQEKIHVSAFLDKLESSTGYCLLLMFVISAIAYLPAMMDFLQGHDYLDHLAWNQQFLDVLRSGTLYPRWMPDINQGNGGPTLIFYPPLYFYLNSLFSWKLGVVEGMQIGAFLFWCGSGVAMFFCARQWLPRSVSLVAALTYLFLPYHLYDLYMRAALAEFSQFLWPPLIVLSLSRLRKGGITSVVLLACTIAGCILTNLPTAIILLYLLGGLALYLLFHSPMVGAKFMIAMVGAILLSSVYLLPAVWELKFIKSDIAVIGFHNYTDHFLFSPAADNPGRRGVLLWALAQAGGLFSLMLVCALPKIDHADVKLISLIRKYFLFLGLFAIFMMLRISAFLWKLPELRFVQYPWRWLLVGTFACSFLVAVRFWFLKHTSPFWVALMFILIVANLGLTGRPWLQRLQIGLSHEDHSYILQNARYFNEITSPTKWAPEMKEGIRLKKGESLKPEATIVKGTGRAKILEWSPTVRQLELNAQSDAQVKLRTYYFPGWNCELDGRTVPIEISPEGQISLSISSGEHHVRCSFSNTPVRTAGSIISLTALIASIIVIAHSNIRRNRSKE